MPRRLFKLVRDGGKIVWGTPSANQRLSERASLAEVLNCTFSQVVPDFEKDISLWPVSPGDEFKPERVLPPILDGPCPAVWCVGLNYMLHAQEAGLEVPRNPTLFMKGINAITGPFDSIRFPRVCRPNELDYETELGVVIGKKCRDVEREEALNYVLGLTVCNDVSARRWQGIKGGNQWVRSKSFDTFLPIGPCLVSCLDVDHRNLQLQTLLTRGHEESMVVQDSNTSDMIFSLEELISFISQDTTLYPGTIVLTGTPQGVGFARKPPVFLQAGDVVQVSISGIGAVENQVVKHHE